MEKVVKILLGLVVIAFFGVAIWAFMQSSETGGDKYKKYDPAKIIEADDQNGQIGDHVRGKKDSKVVVVEYADYECPGCATAAGFMEEIYEKNKDKAAFVFRHYPLHTHANVAAAAAESAGKQGKFWEMSLQLFQNQAEWSDENASNKDRLNLFNTYFAAVAPGGNIVNFENAMSNKNILKKIDFDKNIAEKKTKITETPSFYINGKKFKFSNIDSKFVDDFNYAIEEALNK